MQIKTIVLWWLANEKVHPLLTEEEKTIAYVMPLASTLFPGINYFSMSGFSKVLSTLVIPVIKKRYPELLTLGADRIKRDATTEVTEVLPSNGYEWQDEEDWMIKFNEILAAI